jgi:long-chain acyl-CoA synthetase
MIYKYNTITQMFLASVENFPNNKCFSRFGKDSLELTYIQAKEKVDNIASFLMEKGLGIGDHVGLTGRNSPEWALAYLGILRAGGIVIPVDHSLPIENKVNLFNFSGCKIVFTDLGELSDTFDVYTLITTEDRYILNLNGVQRDFPEVDTGSNAAILFTSGTTGKEKGVMLTHKNFVSDVINAKEYMPLYPTDVFYALLPIHHSYCMTAVF